MRGRLVKAMAMFMAILMMVTSVPLNALAQEAGSSLPLESELQGRDTEMTRMEETNRKKPKSQKKRMSRGNRKNLRTV